MHPASVPRTIRPVLRFANLYQDVGLECFPEKRESFSSKCLLS